MKKYFLKILSFSLVFSFLLQSFVLVSPVSAETINMQYTDPDHLHAPKKVTIDGIETDYQYDNNGNLVNDGEREITWNQDNMPTKIIKGDTEVKFYYDADGRRIVKKTGEDKIVYVNSSYQKSVVNGQETITKYYFANGRRIAIRHMPFAIRYFHQDHLGSNVLATNSDSQSLGESLSYFPYGNFVNNSVTQLSSNPKYLFTGQESDNETGLYNYNARLYNPKTGVFISADTVQGLNRYAYVSGNPINMTDPSGNQGASAEIRKLIRNLIGKNIGRDERGKTNFYFLDFSRRLKKEAGLPMPMILKGFQNESSRVLFSNPEFPVGQRVEIFYDSEMSKRTALAIAQVNRFDPAWAENTMRWIHEEIPYTSKERDSSFWFSYYRVWDLDEKLERDLIVCFDLAAIFSLVATYLPKESEVLSFQVTGGGFDGRHSVARFWEYEDDQRTAWISDPTWGYLVKQERWEEFLLEEYEAVIDWESMDEMIFRQE